MNNFNEWISEPLKNFISDMGDGGTPSREDESNFNGDIPWVVISDIQRNIYNTKENISHKGLASSSAKLWPMGTVILSTGATIGKVGLAHVSLATKQGITGLIPNERINSKLLYYVLTFRKDKIIAWAQGSTFAEIRTPVLGKLPVFIPANPNTQEKIALILETIDQAIEKTETLIEKYQHIKAGLMHDMFTRGIGTDGKLRPPREQAPALYQETLIGWIPKEWEVKELGSCSEIFNGTTPSRQQSLFWNGNIPWISSSKVNDYLVTTPTEYVTELALSKTPLKIIPKNSIIVGLIGDGRTRGMAARLEIDTTINQNLAAIVPNANYSGVFLHQILCYNYDLLRNDGRGSNQGAMNCELLRAFKIACPNFKEQKLMASTLLAYENLIRNEKKLSLKLQQQKSGLMHDLLTSKIQVPINATEATHV